MYLKRSVVVKYVNWPMLFCVLFATTFLCRFSRVFLYALCVTKHAENTRNQPYKLSKELKYHGTRFMNRLLLKTFTHSSWVCINCHSLTFIQILIKENIEDGRFYVNSAIIYDRMERVRVYLYLSTELHH